MKLKEFLENVATTEVVVCIPPRIITEKPELHNFVESIKDKQLCRINQRQIPNRYGHEAKLYVRTLEKLHRCNSNN